MKAVVRVDASDLIGVGHLTRCVTLAQALQQRGAQVRFVCRAHPGTGIAALGEHGVAVDVLPASASGGDALDGHARWLGVPPAVDAQQTRRAIEAAEPDLLVVDHYGIDDSWERLLRPRAGRIMVIDDLADRPHDGDLLLDQNYVPGREEQYRRLVPPGCRLLLGPRYSLLRPEYLSYRRTRPDRDGSIGRLMVFFGGTDPAGLTVRALEVLSEPWFAHLAVDVVVGANNSRSTEIERLAAIRPATRTHAPRPHLADLMAKADLALGAGGSTTWEWLCLGVPLLMISFATNQRPGALALHRDGIAQYLGDAHEVAANDLRTALRKLMSDPATVSELATRARLLVDGRGTARVAEALDPTPTEKLRLRPAEPEDAELYLDWANDPEVRRQARATGAITWEEHRAWFTSKLASPDSDLYVLQAGELPVGQIRFDRTGAEAHLDYSLDPVVRGRGWGAVLVSLGIDAARSHPASRLVADVKAANPASRAVFARVGFEQVETNEHGYVRYALHGGGHTRSR